MTANVSSWRSQRLQARRLAVGLLFVSPWLLGFVLWTVYPMISSLYYSFTRYDLIRPAVYIGLANYIEIFRDDPSAATAMQNTLYYVGLGAPLGVAAAFVMAALLNTEIKGRSVLRAICFFPSIVPVIVIAVVWQFLLSAQWGAVNGTLAGLGLPAIPFLSNPRLSKPTLILIHMWMQGSTIVIFLAALQDVPRSLYEAAMVDGASAWQRFRHITIPMSTPTILFNLIMAFIITTQEFLLPWLLTRGGPMQSLELYALILYRSAFLYLRMGKASALAWILFIVILGFTALLFRSSSRWVHYEDEGR